MVHVFCECLRPHPFPTSVNFPRVSESQRPFDLCDDDSDNTDVDATTSKHDEQLHVFAQVVFVVLDESGDC